MTANATKYMPSVMNIELTTNCPLHCPQCYCSLTGGKNIDAKTAIKRIKEGGEMGVTDVMLSGGETMCYPYLYEIINAAKKYCGVANVALSGFNFTQEIFDRMIDAGVGGIFISLNGSSEEINSQTRDGFDLAIAALKLLSDNGYKNTTINWVMHSSNADDFINVVKLAESYNVANLVIIGVKPDSRHTLSTIPTAEQMNDVAKIVRTHKGKMRIFIESCYSPLLALTCDTKLLGNMNIGKNKGCNAGRSMVSINVNGEFSPCRHLDYFERWDSLVEYWEKSPILQKIRTLDNSRREPCVLCKFNNYCRHCLAINSKTKGELFIGNETCPLAECN